MSATVKRQVLDRVERPAPRRGTRVGTRRQNRCARPPWPPISSGPQGRRDCNPRRQPGTDPKERKAAAAELVAANLDVIAPAGVIDALPVHMLTRTIPIRPQMGQHTKNCRDYRQHAGGVENSRSPSRVGGTLRPGGREPHFSHHVCRPFLPKHRAGSPGQYTELFIRSGQRPAPHRLR